MLADTNAVALIVFNRPEVTKIVFERIRQATPGRLMVIADGPREGRQGEADACLRVRQIVEHVDWPCEVLKNYSAANMGCGARVASGIDWVFQHVEQAIILEDDCLPDPTFFRFCEGLLERYRDEERVMQISGSNFLFGGRATEELFRAIHCAGGGLLGAGRGGISTSRCKPGRPTGTDVWQDSLIAANVPLGNMDGIASHGWNVWTHGIINGRSLFSVPIDWR